MSAFNEMYSINVNDRTEKKNGLTYLSWAWAWAEVKKLYPDANYAIVPQVMDELGNTRFWHDDGRTGWVEVTVTIDGLTQYEVLPIMDYKNKSIPAEQITSFDANKAVKRAVTKAIGLCCGLGLYIYAGEDLPESPDRDAKAEEKAKKDLLYGLDFNIIELAKLRNIEVEQATAIIKTRMNIDGELSDLSADQLQTVFEKVAGWVQKAKDEDTSQN